MEYSEWSIISKSTASKMYNSKWRPTRPVEIANKHTDPFNSLVEVISNTECAFRDNDSFP